MEFFDLLTDPRHFTVKGSKELQKFKKNLIIRLIRYFQANFSIIYGLIFQLIKLKSRI